MGEQNASGAGSAFPSRQAAALRTQQAPPAFAPPPRTSDGRSSADNTDKSSKSLTSSARGPPPQPSCASDFRVLSSSRCGEEVQADFHERQFSVLGDDAFSQELTAQPAQLSSAASQAKGVVLADQRLGRSEVMPDIWQRCQIQNASEELRCLEQNLPSSAKPSPGDELSLLD